MSQDVPAPGPRADDPQAMTRPEPPASAGSDGAGDLKPLISYSLLAGLCPLIPIPFLDDWVCDIFRRRMVQSQAAGTVVHLDTRRVQVLAAGYSPVTPTGCVHGCFVKVVKFPMNFMVKLLIKKVLRKFIFVLAIKDCVDTFSATFHEGYLLRHALRRHEICRLCSAGVSDDDHLHDEEGSFEATVAVREQIEAVRDAVDHRPVERWVRKTFNGSRRLLKQSARILGRQARRRSRNGQESLEDERLEQDVRQKMSAQENHGFDTLVTELAQEIGSETGYLSELERRLDERLDHVVVAQA